MIRNRLATHLIILPLALCFAMACSDDGDSTKEPDKGAQKDFSISDIGGSAVDSGQYSGPNSGKLCKKDSDCKGANEKCLWPSLSKSGMCLMTCTPGTQCPHPSPGPYAAQCAFSYTASGGTKSYACGWYCAYQGVTYKCPNSTDYQCWAPNSSEPHVKFCIPK